jgi:5-methylcytosine-specific restriction enzyme subunit McrC
MGTELMSIYPRDNRDLRQEDKILDRTVSVCTVNLNAPWNSIHEELCGLMR